MFKKLSPREEGQGLVEYALILVLVAIVVIAVLLLLGPAINQAFCKVANALEPGTCGVISSVQVNKSGAALLTVNITVTVSEPVSVTVSVDGESSQTQSCTSSSCPTFTFSTVAPGSSYTITASDGSSESGSL
jgi:pilus assembly protein Flp/PilA